MQTVGRFRLGEKLGEGATGVVFEATDDHGGRVALKLLRPGDATARARFLREARIAAAIRSRHVVPILEVGESDGLTYLVLPFFARGSLAVRLIDGSLDFDETAELAAQLGAGLDALHERSIVHRDVKPSNVLVADDGTAALTDFGLARAADSTRLTQDGQLVGTLQYLAPELIEGGDATPASDIYALGCVLYECVTGSPPFSGRAPAEVGFAHLAEEPPDPRAQRPELGEDEALALLSALQKAPEARPTTGTALARLLHVARNARPR